MKADFWRPNATVEMGHRDGPVYGGMWMPVVEK